ncbi:hypothetical protein [Streptomyces nigrescens]|uniref:hypothetical protein n=1 Tax=Streptomyces nigrescens TaxID=1920 RepID=UPI0036FDC23F
MTASASGPDDIAHAAQELADEAYVAAVQDANLKRLRQLDPDADRIFRLTFTDALVDPSRCGELGDALKQYGAAKHAAGRMDLFGALFAGTPDEDREAFPV